jgi:hypothetical protein
MSKHTSGIKENNKTFKRLILQKIQSLDFPDMIKGSGGHLIAAGMPLCYVLDPGKT